MARLTIEQIKAPDLSVASQATARAGESFREGMSSAQDLLSKYQEGMNDQGDAELTNLLAGAKNEEEWNSIVAKTDFSQMNLSEGMRQQIINRRDNVLGYENQRADTGLVNANTGLASANTGLAKANTGLAYANTGLANANTGLVNANTGRVINLTGIETNQDNRAGEIHKVNMDDEFWRQSARKENASRAGLALDAAVEGMTGGRQNPSSVSGLAPESISGPVGSPTRERVEQNPNQGGPATKAYYAALANSKYTFEADVLDAYEKSYNYAETGKAAITAADAKLAEETLAQFILDLASTNINSSEAIVESRLKNPGATGVERLSIAASVLKATGDGGALSAAQLQIGTTGASPAHISLANTTIEMIQERLKRDPFTRAYIASEGFEVDPAASMSAALSGLEISTIPADVESAINKLAEDLNITPGQAAYSYARAAEEESRFGRFMSIGGDNLSNNAAYDYARENFTGDSSREARNDLATARRQGEIVQQATLELGQIERRIQKLRQQGKTVPASLTSKRDDAVVKLQGLYEDLGGASVPAPASGVVPAATRLERSLREG